MSDEMKPCPHCRGAGEIAVCPDCRNTGYVTKAWTTGSGSGSMCIPCACGRRSFTVNA